MCEKPFKEPRSLVWPLDPREDRVSIWYVCLHHLGPFNRECFRVRRPSPRTARTRNVFFRALAIPPLAARPRRCVSGCVTTTRVISACVAASVTGLEAKIHLYGPMHRWCGPLRGGQVGAPGGDRKPNQKARRRPTSKRRIRGPPEAAERPWVISATQSAINVDGPSWPPAALFADAIALRSARFSLSAGRGRRRRLSQTIFPKLPFSFAPTPPRLSLRPGQTRADQTCGNGRASPLVRS